MSRLFRWLKGVFSGKGVQIEHIRTFDGGEHLFEVVRGDGSRARYRGLSCTFYSTCDGSMAPLWLCDAMESRLRLMKWEKEGS